MSLIVAFKKNNIVTLCCDSLISSEFGKIKLFNKNNLKIFELQGLKNCFLGVVGSCADSSVLRCLKFENINEKFIIDYNFIIDILIPKIIKKLFYYKRINIDEIPLILDSSFFVCQANKLFVINSDLSVFEIDNEEFFCIGSGSEKAMSLLENNKNYYENNYLLKLFDIVSYQNLYVDSPVFYVNTKENKIKKMISFN